MTIQPAVLRNVQYRFILIYDCFIIDYFITVWLSRAPELRVHQDPLHDPH